MHEANPQGVPHLALYAPAAEPLSQPPFLQLPLQTFVTITEKLDVPCCLKLESTAMPMRALTLLFSNEEEMDRWRVALREARSSPMRTEQSRRSDPEAQGAEDGEGGRQEALDELTELTKSEKMANETLQKEYAAPLAAR